MKIRLLAFNRLRTPGLRESADYYAKLLRPWCALEEIELKAMAVTDRSAAMRARVQEKEAELILARSGAEEGRAPLILLDETGRNLPTREWAALAREWEARGSTHLSFCIGGSLGFSERLRKRADQVLSLGAQTLSHDLARVVLIEQLYRTWSVVKGHPYHVEG